jgi:capsid protein
MEPSTIAEVIQALEDGSEPSEFLGYSARVELVKVEARAQKDNQLLMGVTAREEGRYFAYYVCDSLFDVSQWIRLGRVVQNSITVQELKI